MNFLRYVRDSKTKRDSFSHKIDGNKFDKRMWHMMLWCVFLLFLTCKEFRASNLCSAQATTKRFSQTISSHSHVYFFSHRAQQNRNNFQFLFESHI